MYAVLVMVSVLVTVVNYDLPSGAYVDVVMMLLMLMFVNATNGTSSYDTPPIKLSHRVLVLPNHTTIFQTAPGIV